MRSVSRADIQAWRVMHHLQSLLDNGREKTMMGGVIEGVGKATRL
jgi:hypothetical protein